MWSQLIPHLVLAKGWEALRRCLHQRYPGQKSGAPKEMLYQPVWAVPAYLEALPTAVEGHGELSLGCIVWLVLPGVLVHFLLPVAVMRKGV